MPTLGDVVEQVRHRLSGMDARREQVAALSSAITAADTTLVLDGDQAVFSAAGSAVLEVGLELMRVRASSPQDGTVTLWPFGRGYRATTPAAHAAGEEVRVGPVWPAATIAREVNGVLSEVYPLVYGVRSFESTLSTVEHGLPLPADAVGVISVWVAELADEEWVREDNWYFNRDSSTTGRPLFIGSQRDGSRVRVVYATEPALFDLTAAGVLSQPWSATGLSDRLTDLVALGVAKRLAPWTDTAALAGVAAAPTDGRREGNAGGSQTRLLATLFQARLEQESRVLAKEHPIRVHRSR